MSLELLALSNRGATHYFKMIFEGVIAMLCGGISWFIFSVFLPFGWSITLAILVFFFSVPLIGRISRTYGMKIYNAEENVRQTEMDNYVKKEKGIIAQSITCVSCYFPIADDSEFCQNCGFALKKQRF